MRIIYIAKSQQTEISTREGLSQLSERDSIAFFSSFTAAEYFINNTIIKYQIPVDLIIIEKELHSTLPIRFFQNIILFDKNRTFSNKDFNFYTIPTVLLVHKEENASAFKNLGFSEVITETLPELLFFLNDDFVSAVKEWRRHVLDELYNLGVQFNSETGYLNYKYFFSLKFRDICDTKIISSNFKFSYRKLEYDWLKFFSIGETTKAIELYEKEIKKTQRNFYDDEKSFHKLFNKYPFLIKRDNYSRHWYEPQLDYSDLNYFEPDYALQPYFNQLVDLSILEVKLPNESFIKRKNFHPNPYAKFMEHVFQVKDYEDYLENKKYIKNIKKIFGFVPKSIEYNILIGRIDDKNKSEEILNKRMHQMNASHFKLITHDELLDNSINYLERVEKLNIY